jgi:hypothetical protein
MQIEVVDDASEDDPSSVVMAIGRGRVGFARHERNVGHIANFATCLRRSRGKLIHLLHGDDAVRTGFYERMELAFREAPEAGAAFCRQIFIDTAGRWLSLSPIEEVTPGLMPNALARLATEQRIMTPSIVVRRSVYESLGGFDRRLKCSEDWEMWVRIAAAYPIWYEPEPLALYRMHEKSNTGRHVRSAEDMAYTRRAMEMFFAYLPPERAKMIARQARYTYACAALSTAKAMSEHRDFTAFFAQLREALRLSWSPSILTRACWLMLKSGLQTAKSN